MNKFQDIFQPIDNDEHIRRFALGGIEERTEFTDYQKKAFRLLHQRKLYESVRCFENPLIRYYKEFHPLTCLETKNNMKFIKFIIDYSVPPFPYCVVAALQEYIRGKPKNCTG